MIKAVIIDDEDGAIRVLSNMINEYISDVEVIATAHNVPDGVLAINRNKPDVVFLDIEMPDYSGFELLEFFNDVKFEIIFTTAYSNYAIQAFEVSAVDYVLKPIQITKLEVAIEKLRSRLQTAGMDQRLQVLKDNLNENRIRKIALPISDGLYFVNIEDIIHLDADGAYTTVWLKGNSKLLVSKNLKYFEDMLARDQHFFRPHRSHIVNINYLKKYSRADDLLILENNQHVRMAKNRKQEFEELINHHK